MKDGKAKKRVLGPRYQGVENPEEKKVPCYSFIL